MEMGLKAADSRFAWAAATAMLACLVVLLPAGDAEGARPHPKRKCTSFPNQAAAQQYFFKRGGSPRRNFGGLDPDHNGNACDNYGRSSLGSPVSGFATIGYNKRGGFLYGKILTPRITTLFGRKYGCQYDGDGSGKRRVSVYRLGGRHATRIVGPNKGTAPTGKPGVLIWKQLVHGARGRFFVQVEEPMSGLIGKSCKGFRSRAIRVGGGNRRHGRRAHRRR